MDFDFFFFLTWESLQEGAVDAARDSGFRRDLAITDERIKVE